MNDFDGWRRRDVNRMTPAELAIRDAMLAVEAVGADVRLTDSVSLLGEAQERLADFVDNIKPDSTLNARHGAGFRAAIEAVNEVLAEEFTRANSEWRHDSGVSAPSVPAWLRRAFYRLEVLEEKE